MYSFTRTAKRTLVSTQTEYSRLLWKRTEESNSLPSIQQPMVIRQRHHHDRTDLDLAVNDVRFLLHSVHAYYAERVSLLCASEFALRTKDSGLRQVDDGCTVQASENATIGAELNSI